MIGNCATCGIQAELTLHHLVPQSKCNTGKYRKIKDDPNNHIFICRSCHDQIHALYNNNELRDLYNTLDKLINAVEFAKYIKWKKKHTNFIGHSKKSNKK